MTTATTTTTNIYAIYPQSAPVVKLEDENYRIDEAGGLIKAIDYSHGSSNLLIINNSYSYNK